MLRYAITPGTLRPSFDQSAAENALRALLRRAERLAADGADLLLVREKALAAADLVEVCRRFAAVSGSMRVLVSSRPDVALAAGLAGVHLTAAPGELTPAQVRRILPSAFVSVSCHTLAEVRQAQERGAGAALFGPIFGKVVDGVEVAAGVGLPLLREACAAASAMPVLALGGVDASTAPACIAAGARGIAGIRMFFG